MTSKLPNIIFIVLDTVGAKHMSLYGYQRRTTPNLEQLADDCSVYTRCFAPASWTIPSHGSMFTGLYPSQHEAFEGHFCLNPNVQHLVAVLKMQGYETWGISSNGLVSPGSGLLPDFDFFKDFGVSQPHNLANAPQAGNSSGSGELRARLKQGLTRCEVAKIFARYILETRRFKEAWQYGRTLAGKRLRKLGQRHPIVRSSTFTENTVKLFQSLLLQYESNQERPFFLFVNLMEGHERYRPPLKWRHFSRWYDKQHLSMYRYYYHPSSSYKESLLEKYCNLYDDEVRYADDVVRRLWEIGKNSRSNDRTIWIIVSDHGEQFGEKEYYGHGFALYNELIWVPLAIRFPDGLAAPGSHNRLVSLNDLYATLLDLMESPLPRPVSSLSLLDVTARELALAQNINPEFFRNELEGKVQLCQQAGREFSPHTLAVITNDGLKLISCRDGTLEAYHLENDPGESDNLAIRVPTSVLMDWRAMIDALAEETGFPEACQGPAASMPDSFDPEGQRVSPPIWQNLLSPKD